MSCTAKSLGFCLLTLSLCWLTSPAWAAVAGSVETWDADVADWEQSTIVSTVVWAGGGGNPDGHVQIRRDVGGAFFDVGTATTLSSDFLGDYAAAGVAGVSVDVNYMTDNFTDAWLRFRPDVVDNGWTYSLANVFPQNSWTSYTVNFDPTWDDATAQGNGWAKDDAAVPSFADLFASVGWAEVRFASSQESTLVGVDNYRLLAVPEPSTCLLLLCGGAALLRRRRGRVS